MKQRYLVGIIVGIVAVVVAGGYLLFRRPADTPYLPKAQPAAESSPTTSPNSSAATPTPVNAAAAIPQSTSPATSQDGQITLINPTQGATVTSGSTVSGTASASGGKLYYVVKGKQSAQLASGVVNVAAAGATPSAFSFALAFTNQAAAGDQGVLELYGLNSSGVQENETSIGVYLR